MQPLWLVLFIGPAAAVANALNGARADGTPLPDPAGAEANKVNLAIPTPIDEANPGIGRELRGEKGDEEFKLGIIIAKESDSCPRIDGVRSCHNKYVVTSCSIRNKHYAPVQ